MRARDARSSASWARSSACRRSFSSASRAAAPAASRSGALVEQRRVVDERGERLVLRAEHGHGAARPVAGSVERAAVAVDERPPLREPEPELERRVAERPRERVADRARRRVLELDHEVGDRRARAPAPQRPGCKRDRDREHGGRLRPEHRSSSSRSWSRSRSGRGRTQWRRRRRGRARRGRTAAGRAAGPGRRARALLRPRRRKTEITPIVIPSWTRPAPVRSCQPTFVSGAVPAGWALDPEPGYHVVAGVVEEQEQQREVQLERVRPDDEAALEARVEPAGRIREEEVHEQRDDGGEATTATVSASGERWKSGSAVGTGGERRGRQQRPGQALRTAIPEDEPDRDREHPNRVVDGRLVDREVPVTSGKVALSRRRDEEARAESRAGEPERTRTALTRPPRRAPRAPPQLARSSG